MRVFVAVLARDLRLSVRHGADTTAALLFFLGLMPMLPFLPFATLAGALAYLGKTIPEKLAKEREARRVLMEKSEAEAKLRKERARGQAVVVMDADLQDPPEVVLALVAKWREGFDVVAAQRLSRAGESRFKRLTAALFYRLIGRLSDVDLPPDGGDFRFLFHPQRKLLAVGFNVSEHRGDNRYYDLLASEARLASFIAIAKGDIPARHWFRLGRTVTPVGSGADRSNTPILSRPRKPP